MLNSIFRFLSLSRRSNRLEVPLVGLLLSVGISTAVAKPALNNELHPIDTSQTVVRAEASGKDNAVATRVGKQDSTSTGKLPEVDGIYLYGQSPAPEQIGQEYMVFELRQGKVIGAFYMPHSEFSCFNGTVKSGQLSLMIANSPDSEAHPETVAAQYSQQVATASNIPIENAVIAYPYLVALQNYHQLPSASANDQQLLQSCKANY